MADGLEQESGGGVDSAFSDAIGAVGKLYRKMGSKSTGLTFASDVLWENFASPPMSVQRPPTVIRLAREGYIVKTGGTTKATTGARKGSPTTEYTFGSKITGVEPVLSNTVAPAHEENKAGNANGILKLPFPVQWLLHGCPGSGKSHILEEAAKSAHFVIRTVFHPETRYSDFVGGLRPTPVFKIDNQGAKYIGTREELPGEPFILYELQPGPMLKAYELACLHPTMSVVLIVEELSRGPASEIFGDMLQLLDRTDEATSELDLDVSKYVIDPHTDVANWLVAADIVQPTVPAGRMRLPSNLYIWATMNRADQNARQLDAAFLRRWTRKYVSYKDPGAYDPELVRYGGKKIPWSALRNKINVMLENTPGVSEDKFIGPYLLPKRKLADPSAIAEDLWGYLWNDVLKTRASSFFEGATTFAELHDRWASGNGTIIGEIQE